MLTARYSYAPSQADVVCFKGLQSSPNTTKYPYAARWYRHIESYSEDFATLHGDNSKSYTTYGPDVTEATLHPAKAPAVAEEEEEVDLFGSDDEEDVEAAKLREERLAEYKKKKEGKTKPAAKSVVTMEVKPWGIFHLTHFFISRANYDYRRRDRYEGARGVRS
jgi:elongation factor 1-beta